jgi:hypothetical protein
MHKSCLVLLVSLVIFSPFSFAADYRCFAKANPLVGLGSHFNIWLSDDSVGGEMYMISENQQIDLGTISEITILYRHDANLSANFEYYLNQIAGDELSGLVDSDLAMVTTLRIYKIENTQDLDIYLYKIYSGPVQISGTIFISMIATMCSP